MCYTGKQSLITPILAFGVLIYIIPDLLSPLPLAVEGGEENKKGFASLGLTF
jgi:hypothetical protein